MIIVMIMITTQMIKIMWLNWGLCLALSFSLHTLINIVVNNYDHHDYCDDHDHDTDDHDYVAELGALPRVFFLSPCTDHYRNYDDNQDFSYHDMS